MNWPSHLALHEERQELFVANDADDSVLVFRTTDKGDVAPIRVIKGPNTGIKHPPGITLDTETGRALCREHGKSVSNGFPGDGQWRCRAVANDSRRARRQVGAQDRQSRRLSDTTPNEIRFWCPTEWPIRKLRRSPGWRTEVTVAPDEPFLDRPANCPEQCMIFATMKNTMNLLWPTRLPRRS